MRLIVALLLIVAVSLPAFAVQPLPKRCQLFEGGYPTAEAIRKHGTSIIGLTTPGWMYAMNQTVMEDPIPGQTTFVDEHRSTYFQFNSFKADNFGCAFAFDQYYTRAAGHIVVSEWISTIHEDQTSPKPLAGSGKVDLLNTYAVQMPEPILFNFLAIPALKLRSAQLSTFSSMTTFNYELPDGTEIPIVDEILIVTPKTLSNLQVGHTTDKEFYYSIDDHTGDPNGFVDWLYIFRKEWDCAGATGDLADACECRRRHLAGELTLENDPLAAAAGTVHLVLTCRIESAKMTDNSQVLWPSDSLSTATYKLAASGDITISDAPLRYVSGMPATTEEHQASFFGCGGTEECE